METNEPIERKLFDKPRIARRYTVSTRSIDNWMLRGLPHIKLSSKCVRFDPVECDAFVARFKVEAKN